MLLTVKALTEKAAWAQDKALGMKKESCKKNTCSFCILYYFISSKGNIELYLFVVAWCSRHSEEVHAETE